MKDVTCNECGFSIGNKDSGVYYCENCGKNMKFFTVQTFFGAKPDSELYEHE